MAALDLERFWQENDLALADPFSPAIPRPPISHGMGYHTAFDELGVEEDMLRLETDFEHARGLARRYNELSLSIIGRKVVDENAYDPSRQFPRIKGVGEVFGCRRIWQANSWWLLEVAHTPSELSALLDRIDKLDVRSAMLPDDWEAGCRAVFNRHGHRPGLWRGLRGPVTLATSIYGVENLIYLILDQPDLAARLRDAILRVALEYYALAETLTFDGEPIARPGPGFWFYDDNCAMLTAEMYAFFGQPVLQAIYDRFSPAPDDMRYQHSDSDMGHLLPLLAQTGMKRVNFGPNVRFAQIRQAMPQAVVEGTLAPFTLMRNDLPGIEREIRRDLDEARATRGLIVATAGSVNNGTRLASVRHMMEVVHRYGSYA